MALTELQEPDKAAFYQKCQSIGSELERKTASWKSAYEFLASMDVATLDNMGVPAGTVRTHLVNLRRALEDIVSLLEGNAVASPQTNIPNAIDNIRNF